MKETNLVIKNKLGLHARAAAMIVQNANKFSSEIKILKDGFEVNAKSIMGIMMLAASPGSTITVKAEGRDEELAVNSISQLVDNKFGEE